MPIHLPKKRERKREPGILKETSSSLERRVLAIRTAVPVLRRDGEVEQWTGTGREKALILRGAGFVMAAYVTGKLPRFSLNTNILNLSHQRAKIAGKMYGAG